MPDITLLVTFAVFLKYIESAVIILISYIFNYNMHVF